MRTDFNVLWVEDQENGVKSQREGIARRLRTKGFRLQTEFAGSVAKAKEYLADDVYGDHIDLVLMDYDLGEGKPDGSGGLRAVRKQFPYKDIVFYSGKGVKALKTKVAEQQLQGIFCSHRDSLTDTVVGICDTLIKKVIDIDHSRGIVMGATSEIDDFIKRSIMAIYEKGDGDFQKKVFTIVLSHLRDIEKSFVKSLAKAQAVAAAASDITELFKLHHLYTSSHRLRLLWKMLQQANSHKEERELIRAYQENDVPKRNALAHVSVKREGFSRKIFNAKGEELTISHMEELRISLLEHHELFEKLSASLTSA